MKTTWARHSAGLSWCAVADTTTGSVTTYCRGRWSLTDDYEIHDNPPMSKCGACERRVAELERIEQGLVEMSRFYAFGTRPAPVNVVVESAEVDAGVDDLFDYGEVD